MENKIIISVKEILSKEAGEIKEDNFDSKINNIDEIKANKPIAGEIKITNIGESNLIVSIKTSPELILFCSRCAKEFIYKMNLKFDNVFNFNPDDDEFNIEKNIINIWPAIREQIILNIPMKPLCNKKCKGIIK